MAVKKVRFSGKDCVIRIERQPCASHRTLRVALPPGWVCVKSKSRHNEFYYFNRLTGESSWKAPGFTRANLIINSSHEQTKTMRSYNHDKGRESPRVPVVASPPIVGTKPPHDTLAKSEFPISFSRSEVPNTSPTLQPQRIDVLHILKKHKDSRRPSSWRSDYKEPILRTREEAWHELEKLLEIMRQSKDSSTLDDWIATFRKLALEESDDSSAKRHGDLGLVPRNKMLPEFEQAASALQVHELSGIVESASGMHIILRLG